MAPSVILIIAELQRAKFRFRVLMPKTCQVKTHREMSSDASKFNHAVVHLRIPANNDSSLRIFVSRGIQGTLGLSVVTVCDGSNISRPLFIVDTLANFHYVIWI